MGKRSSFAGIRPLPTRYDRSAAAHPFSHFDDAMKRLFLLSIMVLGGCAPSAPSPAAPIHEPVIHPVDFAAAWTARDGVTLLQGEGDGTYFLRPFTRLTVIGGERGGLRVRCESCPWPVEAILASRDLIYTSLPPEIAAWGTLAEFAHAIRTAAESHDLDLLRPVMNPDFSFSLVGPQTPTAAFEVWRSEGFVSLDELPDLLDQGLATRDSVIWSAPPAYTADLYYRGSRIGFRRRADGRWEWLFLMAGLRR